MKFCTHCGQPLIRMWIENDLRQRDVCGTCNAVQYENPKVLVACIVCFKDSVVLCRRAIMPAKGLWYFVTGFVEAGESLEEAAARELLEETGLRVPACEMQLKFVASMTHICQIYVGFLTRLPMEPDFRVGPEVMEARLFSEAEFPFDQFAFSDIITTENVHDLYRQIRTGDLPVSLHAYPMRSRNRSGKS